MRKYAHLTGHEPGTPNILTDDGSIVHGRNGWRLVEYERNPDTGIGDFKYERTVQGVIETATEMRYQPSTPEHVGW